MRPGLDLRVAGLRTVRLGRTFDLITCLGNSLAYLHTDDDLTAAAATFAAHAHPGTILIINTLTAPPTDHGQSTAARVDTRFFTATVTLRTHWDTATRIHTTWRHWTFTDGTTITDHLTRRVTTPGELDRLLRAAGFTSVKIGETFTAQYRPGGARRMGAARRLSRDQSR